MATESDLVDRVMELSAAERAQLARKLILSLEPADFDADVDAVWETEIEHRLGQVDRGEVPLQDWRDSVKRIRDTLKRPEAG